MQLNEKKSLKRTHGKTKEFMPLSSSKLFEADDNCEYDWGFKKIAKKSVTEAVTPEIKKPIEDERNVINRRNAYKVDDPLKLKEEDKGIYLENLNNIYTRNYVYIPSFCEIDDVVSNTNVLIDNAVVNAFKDEAKRLDDLLVNLWEPLYNSYVETGRLSSECGAFKMISKGVDQYTKARQVFLNCIDNFGANVTNFKEVINAWKITCVDNLTKIFQDVVGVVLLRYKDEVSVSLDDMSHETNAAAFMRMVSDDVSVVQERVDKLVGKRKRDKTESNKVEKITEEEENTREDRPISKEMMKNRGLTPYRKKTNKNPRLKHRMKYKKAVVRQHSQVPRERMDAGNYEGEKSGIRIGVIKAKKFK